MATTTESVKTEQQGFYLVITQPFGGYNRGDQVTDSAEIEKILTSDRQGKYNKVNY